MRNFKTFLLLMLLSLPIAASAQTTTGAQDREFWCDLTYRIAAPILENMSKGRLQKEMLVETSPTWDGRDIKVTYMEAFGRTIAGVAPWLALPDDNTKEGKMRRQMREWALKCYANAVDPESPDYLLWDNESQPLVDAAYIAESFLRAYDQLWVPLDDLTKERYIKEFQQMRRVDPDYSNWLLFAATVESFLKRAGAQYDEYRIKSALRKIDEWYVGDGLYSDGVHFAMDYYNSYVIHPMYVECIDVMTEGGTQDVKRLCDKEHYGVAKARMQRYATILERLISPEGTLPVFGRSIPYRSGTLQALGWIAWQGELAEELEPAQVRCAMSAVLRNFFGDDRNFNEKGYITIGYNGELPECADWYTNNGSLYMASLALLPLGLPADDPFWSDEARDWTSKRAWAGAAFPKDHSYKESKSINE